MNQKLLLLAGVPMLGGMLVLCGIWMRHRAEATVVMPHKGVVRVAPVEGPIQAAPPPRSLPALAPEKTVAAAMDEGRLKTTYQNYRTALATGNRAQADALYPVLTRDRKAALRMAQQDLAQAREDFDRTVA